MGSLNLDLINRAVETDPALFIKLCEEMYEACIRKIADRIDANSEDRAIVLLAGPSGSGKTTSARLIERVLDRTHETHIISMDNYYYRDEKMELPLDEEGNVDLESPLFLDVELLQRHIRKLNRGEAVEIPTFDFARQRRGEEVIPLKRKKKEIIVLEGIHALNKEVAGKCMEYAQTLFVSPCQDIETGQGAVSQRLVRLMRRMQRDLEGRGSGLLDTAARLKSVSRGEDLYILPNRGRAEMTLDTSIPYEIAVYANRLLPALRELEEGTKEELPENVKEVMKVLEITSPVSPDLVPEDAMIREFIGGLNLDIQA